jgi:2-phosphoglycerate kinase
MATAYFIGGASRTGKSSAMQLLLQRQPILAASTDVIRDMLKGILPKAQYPDLFKAGRGPLDSKSNLKAMWERPESVIPHHIKESEVVWKSVRDFMDANLNADRNCAIEGVAILPRLLKDYKRDFKAVFIVNPQDQTEAILAHAKANRHDWLNFYSEEAIRAFAHFNMAMNRYYSEEATKYGFPVVTVGEDFDAGLGEVVKVLLENDSKS